MGHDDDCIDKSCLGQLKIVFDEDSRSYTFSEDGQIDATLVQSNVVLWWMTIVHVVCILFELLDCFSFFSSGSLCPTQGSLKVVQPKPQNLTKQFSFPYPSLQTPKKERRQVLVENMNRNNDLQTQKGTSDVKEKTTREITA